MPVPLQAQRNLYAMAVGVAGGVTVGICGWGGAQVIIPSMTMAVPFANCSQLSATGISLSSLSISSLSSGYAFWQENRVHLPVALAIGIPAVLSARLGSHVAKRLSGDALALFFNGFSIVLIPTHFWIQKRAQSRLSLERENKQTESKKTAGQDNVPSTFPRNLAALSSVDLAQHASYGLCSGIISALMGVGGLPLTMSYITETTQLPHHFVQGTAVCALVPSIIVSAASRATSVPIQATGCVAVGAVVGSYCGARAALQMTDEELRWLYMGSLVVFGSRSAFGASRNIRRILAKTTK